MVKANESNLQINAQNLDLSDKVWEDLKRILKLRKGFKISSQVVTVPAYFYRFIGIKENNEEYFDDILRIDRELKFLGTLYLKITEGFSRDISIKIQSVLYGIKNFSNDINILIQNAEENNLFSQFNNTSMKEQIKNNLKVVLDYYLRLKGDSDGIINKFGLMVYWINKYIPSLLINYNYDEMNPKVLYYGKITEEEGLFLFLLWTLGIDVIFYSTEEDNVFKTIDPYNSFSREVTFSKRCSLKELPDSFSERINTTAFGAKEELDKILYNEDTNFYRPWQFTEYDIDNVTLKTTFEEIFIWANEKASIRQGWKAQNKKVYIPNIFAKVRGVSEDIEQYFKYIQDFREKKNVKFINKLPMLEFVKLEYSKLNEIYPANSDYFDVDRMINSSWWPYNELRTGVQRALGENIRELCLNPIIYNKQNDSMRDFQVEIFSVLINGMDKGIMELLQGFDYPEEVPKIIIYNNEQNGNLSMEDCILLTLLNYMGLDIIIFNPSGYNDIENYIYSEVYDVHTLDKMSFNLKLRKPVEEKKGFFKKLFGI